MTASAIGARVAGAGFVYAIALAAAVGVGCAAPGFSCSLSSGANAAASAAMIALALFALGLVLMGSVLTPAAMLLRRIKWLYWWSVLPIAAATAALPLAVICALPGGDCRGGAFGPLAGALTFAGLSGGLFLWRTWLRHHASEPALARRLAVQPPAVKLGLIFAGGYLAVLTAAAAFVATSSGDMSGMVFFFIAQPWPLVGSWFFGFGGATAGMPLGLALNGALAFGIGYGVSRACRRNKARMGAS
jgi:hypothetical protein